MEERVASDIANTVPAWTEMLISHGPIGLLCLALMLCVSLLVRYILNRDKQHFSHVEQFTEVMKTHAVNEAAQTEVMRANSVIMNDLKALIVGLMNKK